MRWRRQRATAAAARVRVAAAAAVVGRRRVGGGVLVHHPQAAFVEQRAVARHVGQHRGAAGARRGGDEEAHPLAHLGEAARADRARERHHRRAQLVRALAHLPEGGGRCVEGQVGGAWGAPSGRTASSGKIAPRAAPPRSRDRPRSPTPAAPAGGRPSAATPCTPGAGAPTAPAGGPSRGCRRARPVRAAATPAG
jgi:hypothetical protein